MSRLAVHLLGPPRAELDGEVVQIGLSRASDSELLNTAQEQNRIMVTRDRDFGGLVFVRGLGAGVIYLRILPTTQSAVHAEIERVLDSYSEEELRTAFVVIEPGRHRFRKLPRRHGDSV